MLRASRKQPPNLRRERVREPHVLCRPPCRVPRPAPELRAVTPKVLSETLRAMERDGLLTRTAYDENPPRVEYALTPLGRTLIPLLDAARIWSRTHLPHLLAARRAHERSAS
ncbi:helix-turn-helix domain-containing protein [Streptomyces sp. ALI-76-A]|uniref:winged helix-turn-helix transcriptional regulator n=1 Tax=Streptomyces sp. ALI-76-A TaxID=3025736 RepID=UPI00256EE2EF|nr:helix-turn-helix domain-containing protein [Streptomyces sp. ALI-76-A]MDL5200924.1 helix-turn-helix domain-containing protein [Streptomyces sp. ALI-76-A]